MSSNFDFVPNTSIRDAAERLTVAMRSSGKWWRTRDTLLFAIASNDLLAVTTPGRLSSILCSSQSGISFAGEPIPRETLDELAARVLADFVWMIGQAGTRPRDPLIGYPNKSGAVIR